MVGDADRAAAKLASFSSARLQMTALGGGEQTIETNTGLCAGFAGGMECRALPGAAGEGLTGGPFGAPMVLPAVLVMWPFPSAALAPPTLANKMTVAASNATAVHWSPYIVHTAPPLCREAVALASTSGVESGVRRSQSAHLISRRYAKSGSSINATRRLYDQLK